jgi:non-heme chloroperoxidase
VSKAVLMGALQPFLLKTDEDPIGLEQSVIDGLVAAIQSDRLAHLAAFLNDFYDVDDYLGKRLSEEVFRDSWNVASGASPIGTPACPPTWVTDFRPDLPKIDVPTLIVHGDADRILPIDMTARRLPELIAGSRLVEIPGGPHGMGWTHAEEVNRVLLDFLAEDTVSSAGSERSAVA